MTLTVRNFEVDRDAAFVAKMFSWNDQFTWNAGDVAANYRRFPASRPVLRLVVESDGELVAYGRTCLFAPNPRNAFFSEVLVLPEHQRQGIGRDLVNRLEGFANEHQAQKMAFMVYDRKGGSLPAAEAMGYATVTNYYQSEIDPRTFDLSVFEPYLSKAKSFGYEVKALADLPVCDETDRNYYAAVHSADKDAPFMDYFGWPTYEEFRQVTIGAQWFDRNGVFVAVLDGEIVGSSGVNRGSIDFNGEMFIDFTGVVREHRGKGLAVALKAKATDFARQIGGTMLRTENNIDNPAMRAVNKKLGFKETPGMWMVVKEL